MLSCDHIALWISEFGVGVGVGVCGHTHRIALHLVLLSAKAWLFCIPYHRLKETQ